MRTAQGEYEAAGLVITALDNPAFNRPSDPAGRARKVLLWYETRKLDSTRREILVSSSKLREVNFWRDFRELDGMAKLAEHSGGIDCRRSPADGSRITSRRILHRLRNF